jgi:hypothetical protein
VILVLLGGGRMIRQTKISFRYSFAGPVGWTTVGPIPRGMFEEHYDFAIRWWPSLPHNDLLREKFKLKRYSAEGPQGIACSIQASAYRKHEE